ncbi:MAG: hypothetical protein Q9157_003718 [Trypethelium eluteriae]
MASATVEVPENLQITQDLAKDLIEDHSAETATSLKPGRSFVPSRKAAAYPRTLEKTDRAQYTARPYGPVMNVTIINFRQDASGRWLYQAQDTDNKPVKKEGKNEPEWIPETKLRKLQPATSG